MVSVRGGEITKIAEDRIQHLEVVRRLELLHRQLDVPPKNARRVGRERQSTGL
jgi:hypothetical protein